MLVQVALVHLGYDLSPTEGLPLAWGIKVGLRVLDGTRAIGKPE